MLGIKGREGDKGFIRDVEGRPIMVHDEVVAVCKPPHRDSFHGTALVTRVDLLEHIVHVRTLYPQGECAVVSPEENLLVTSFAPPEERTVDK